MSSSTSSIRNLQEALDLGQAIDHLPVGTIPDNPASAAFISNVDFSEHPDTGDAAPQQSEHPEFGDVAPQQGEHPEFGDAASQQSEHSIISDAASTSVRVHPSPTQVSTAAEKPGSAHPFQAPAPSLSIMPPSESGSHRPRSVVYSDITAAEVTQRGSDKNLKDMFCRLSQQSQSPSLRFPNVWSEELSRAFRRGSDRAALQAEFPIPSHTFCKVPQWTKTADMLTRLMKVKPDLYSRLIKEDKRAADFQQGIMVAMGPFHDLTEQLGGSLRPPVLQEVRSLSALGQALGQTSFSMTRSRRESIIDHFPWKHQAKELFVQFKERFLSYPAVGDLISEDMLTSVKDFMKQVVELKKAEQEMDKVLNLPAASTSFKSFSRPTRRSSDKRKAHNRHSSAQQDQPAAKRQRVDNGSSSKDGNGNPGNQNSRGQGSKPFQSRGGVGAKHPPRKNRLAHKLLDKHNSKSQNSQYCQFWVNNMSKFNIISEQSKTPQSHSKISFASGGFSRSKFVEQRHHSESVLPPKSVCLPNFSNRKKLGGPQNDPKFETAQQSSKNVKISYGESEYGTRLGHSERLDGKSRPEGRLLLDSNLRRIEEVAHFPMERSLLPVQPDAKRFEPSTPRVFQTAKTSHRISEEPRCKTLHVPGRSFCVSSGQKCSSKAPFDGERTDDQSRLCHKRIEVIDPCSTKDRVSRLPNLLLDNDSNSTVRKTGTIERVGCICSSTREGNNQGDCKSLGFISGSRPSYKNSEASLSSPSETEDHSPEKQSGGLQCSARTDSRVSKRASLVARISPNRSSCSMESGACVCRKYKCSRYKYLYRQLAGYVGRFLLRRRHSRQLGHQLPEVSHKRTRIESSQSSPAALYQEPVSSNSDSSYRQQNSLVVPQADGRYQESSSEQAGSADLGLADQKADQSEPEIHTIEGKSSSRFVVKAIDSKTRVDSESPSIRINNNPLGTAKNRPLCNKQKLSSSEVFCMGSRQSGDRTGRTGNQQSVAETAATLCLSTGKLDSKNAAEVVEIKSTAIDPDSTGMENQILVPGPTESACRFPTIASRLEQSNNGPAQPQPSTSREEPRPSIKGMDGLLKRVKEEGFSTKAAEYIRLKWRKGSRKTYESYWRSFSCWCAERKVDPFSATPPIVAEYLVHLFHDKDLATSSVTIARSAISCFAKPIDGVPLGEHKRICELMKALKNIKPPTARYSATWSIDSILGFWDTQKENSLLPLKLLSFKAVTLTAISALSRADELAHLLRENYREASDGNGLLFLLDKAPKNHQHGPVPPVMIEAIPDRPNICPVICLTEYMRVTQQFRELNDGQSRTRLFLSLDSRHCNVKVASISRWIQQTMELAGIDTSSFKAHSIRGASVSHLANKGLSIKQIMKRGKWKSNSVLGKFYIRDLPR